MVGRETKILVKLGAWNEPGLSEIIVSIAPHVDGLIAINAIPYRGHTVSQGADLDRGVLAVSGAPIKQDARRTVGNIVRLRAEHPDLQHLALIACGGVTSPADVTHFLKQGAELVGSQTAVLNDPYFIWKVHAFMATNNLYEQERQDQANEVVARELGKALLLWHRKYGDTAAEHLHDSVIIRTLGSLMRASETAKGVRRPRFKYAKDILAQLEQAALRTPAEKGRR